MGRPKIDVVFKQLAGSIIQRSEKGRLMLLVVDDEATADAYVKYTSAADVPADKYSEENARLIKEAFMGGPREVQVLVTKSTDSFSDVVVPKLKTLKFDWIAFLSATQANQTALVEYVKGHNATSRFKIKAVIYKGTAIDDKHFFNLTTEKFNTIAEQNQAGWKLLGRMAGIAAGLPFSRSTTYHRLPDIEWVSEPADIDKAIKDGEWVLFNDDDGVRIASGNNALTTVTADNTEDMKSMAIVEAMDLIERDIYTAFKAYVGNYKNKYDHQALFLASVNGYFDILASQDILDPGYKNEARIDVEAQRKAWIAVGKAEAANWTEPQVKANTFKRQVFVAANIKILDAMEDLTFVVTLM